MKSQNKTIHPIISEINNMLVDLSAPSSISFMWNWGSLLGLTLVIQLLTGLLLASHYNSSIELAFYSVIHIMRDVNWGWLLRMIHMNGASMFFTLIFIHISRGMLFSSFKSIHVWGSGVSILFVLMGAGFMGYVLPWGQMSFWGATVITNLVSAIPYIGTMIVQWLWGGFSVGGATLSRFFMLHFLLPFLLAALVIIHLMSLHMKGSNNPIGLNGNYDKVNFHPYFTIKDLMGILVCLGIFLFITLLFPYDTGDPENFNPANPLNTPIHIQPEWYFLFAYAILRSIPNKLGGVVALVLSILMIMVLPFKSKTFLSKKFSISHKLNFWLFSAMFIVLTWIGANPVEYPFELIGQLISIFYFIFLLLL